MVCWGSIKQLSLPSSLAAASEPVPLTGRFNFKEDHYGVGKAKKVR
jgi:hypothetical protein